MPAESTLLAYLTPRLTDRVEDMAVEALGYILSKSPSSRSALNRVLQSGAAGLDSIVQVRTQLTGETGARPDLVGFDDQNAERVLIEAKFWAGLTENQPNGYLERLPNDGPSALLFVAPEARLDTLWAELIRRVNIELGHSTEGDGLRSVTVEGGQRYLMLTSWRSLLGQMANETSHTGESSAQIDIRQLQGLTERMDDEAFLPIQSTELGPEFPQRILGLNNLIDDATNRGIDESWIEKGRMQRTPLRTGYGRYISLSNTIAWFGVNFELWAGKSDTPLWLDFRSYGAQPDARKRLNLGVGEEYVPIRPPLGVEYDAVLEAVVKALKEVKLRLNPECGS